MKNKLLLVSTFCFCLSFVASDCSNDNASPISPNNSIGVIAYTDDGGDTWLTKNVVLAGQVSAITTFPFDMDTFCIVVDYPYPDNQQIFRTTNNGDNFYSVYSSPNYINDITGMITEGKGFAACSNGIILVTTNYGATWTEINTGTASSLKSIDFGNESNGILIGETNILTTIDGGLNWVIRNGIADLNCVSYISSTEAITCGGLGKIYRTSDNGENWTQVSSPVNSILESVDFINPVGIIGYSGTMSSILRTTDRGLNWYAVPTPDQGSVFKVYTEGSHYWLISVVDILRSDDQGATWVSCGPGNLSPLDGVFMKNMGILAGRRLGN